MIVQTLKLDVNSISGQGREMKTKNVDLEYLAAESNLLSIGDFEPLDIKIDCSAFSNEIDKFSSDWVDYLPRPDRANNRKAITLFNYSGWGHSKNPSMPESIKEIGRLMSELEFNEKTNAYYGLPSLHDLLDKFDILGRTFIINCGIGGYFVPHRDHPTYPREVFRLVCFLKNCETYDYDWLVDDKKINIEQGRVYYVNTRRMHRTISWVQDSMHLILNVPFNIRNVNMVLKHLQHRH
jgi:hypothetical protein